MSRDCLAPRAVLVYNVVMVKLIEKDVAARLAQFGRIAVAVSGGRDSVALLDALVNSGDHRGELVVVHVDHKMRGSESDGDREFVLRLAANYGVPVKTYEVDVPAFCLANGYGAEQGARIVRRRIFRDMVESGEVERVLTAHHLSDQTESVLMHVFRGSGIEGVCGMKEDDGVVFRPLLAVPSETVAEYAAKRGLEWRVDSTNSDTAYSRNYLRHVVIPAIEKLYPTLEANVARLSQAARDTAELVRGMTACVQSDRCGQTMPLSALEAPPAIASANVLKLLAAAGARVDSERAHIEAILDLKNKKTGARVCLPHFYVAEKRDGYVVVYRDDGVKDLTEIPFGKGKFRIAGTNFEVSEGGEGSRLDERAIPPGSVFRTRRDGDVFTKFGGGTKSLGDWLTDKKVPVGRRDKLVVLAHGNRVLAVVGMEISDAVKVVDGSKVVVIKEEI